MKRYRLGSLLCVGLSALAAFIPAKADKVPEELIQYLQNARRQGLGDNEIQQKAIVAGWNKDLVTSAMTAPRVNSEVGSSPARLASVPQPPGRSTEKGYRIGPGDVLQIVVWKEPEASVPSVIVRSDGKITIPLVKEIGVAGLTPSELEKLLTEKLSRFIRDADVTVIPREITSQKVYLLGAVRREGPVPLLSSMTVLQALNAGGGLTEYAKKKKIYILRNENGKQIRLPFDYTAVIRGQRPEQNILVKVEDTIVVP